MGKFHYWPSVPGAFPCVFAVSGQIDAAFPAHAAACFAFDAGFSAHHAERPGLAEILCRYRCFEAAFLRFAAAAWGCRQSASPPRLFLG